MTFNDIFKSSFLENVNSISLLDMGIALVLAFLLGLFIFMIYKKTFSGVMYSSSFGVTLIALTMITTLVIMAVTVMWCCPSAWWVLCLSSDSALPSKSRWILRSCSGPSLWVSFWQPV